MMFSSPLPGTACLWGPTNRLTSIRPFASRDRDPRLWLRLLAAWPGAWRGKLLLFTLLASLAGCSRPDDSRQVELVTKAE